MLACPARRTACVAALVIAAVALVLGSGPSATADGHWAPAAEASIAPGSQMVTNGAQCTANFIFEGAGSMYIGYAAHCAGAGGGATDTNGCLAPSLPTDGSTEVDIEGASRPGTLVYSSWETMQRVGETDEDTCNYNDFALVEIHPDDHASVNPSIPHWGGPTALNTEGTAGGEILHGYGNSRLRLGIRVLSPKTGLSLGTAGGGWTHPAYTLSPGIPGDSGSALLDSQGRAVGVLSTLVIAPLTGSNNYSDLARALDYMRTHSGVDAELALGTEAFDGRQLPLDLGALSLG